MRAATAPPAESAGARLASAPAGELDGPDEVRVGASLALGVSAYALGVGADPARVHRLLERLGLEGLRPDGYVRLESLVALFDDLARLSHDDAFGIHYGTSPALVEALGVLGLLCRSAATFGDALTLGQRYESLLLQTPGARATAVQLRADALVMVDEVPVADAERARHFAEMSAATVAHLTRVWACADGDLLELRFRHAAPRATAAHAQAFGPARLVFGAARDEVTLSRRLLSKPMRHADPLVARVLESLAQAQARARRPGGDEGLSLRERAERLVREHLHEGKVPALDVIARRLCVSGRTLQRQLTEHGLTFRSLLDVERQALATQLLRDRSASLSDVALRLGFFDERSLRRARKRWADVPAPAPRRDPPAR
ncbi:MAG TPA: AraC family transcriptional regulator ligand-binding domain-containing protein [Polyangiaceae bacterium]|nr:AraC family transcriptional regulator ligand-binding domain-containing protein [Polyangiaceae bacterium]